MSKFATPTESEYSLRSALARLERSSSRLSPPPVAPKRASVLIGLFPGPSGEARVLLTLRSRTLRTHAGQVSLPGGKADPEDVDDASTALREAREELGLDPRHVRVVGCLPPFLSPHLLSVTPVVASIDPAALGDLAPNPDEVEDVFSAPLRLFVEPGEAHSHRDIEYHSGLPYRVHSFHYDEPGGKPRLIWGLTAGILLDAAERAFGRPPAFARDNPAAAPGHRFALAESGDVVSVPVREFW